MGCISAMLKDDPWLSVQPLLGPSGLIGWHCKHRPRNFAKIAEEAVVIWLAWEMRCRKERIVSIARRTYLRIRSAEPYLPTPNVPQILSRHALPGDRATGA